MSEAKGKKKVLVVSEERISPTATVIIKREMDEDEYKEYQHTKQKKRAEAHALFDELVDLQLKNNGGLDRTPIATAIKEMKWENPGKRELIASVRSLRENYLRGESKPLWLLLFPLFKRAFEGKEYVAPTKMGKGELAEDDKKEIGEFVARVSYIQTVTGKPPQNVTPQELQQFESNAIKGIPFGLGKDKKLAKQFGEKLAASFWLDRELYYLLMSHKLSGQLRNDMESRAAFGASPKDQWFKAATVRNGALKTLWEVVTFCCDEEGNVKPEYFKDEDDDDEEEDDEESDNEGDADEEEEVLEPTTKPSGKENKKPTKKKA